MELKQKALSGIKWTGVSSLLIAVFKLLQVCVLTRFVSQTDLGIVAIALLIISYSDIVADLGITSAVLHKQHITVKQYSSLFWINLSLSIFLTLFLFALAPYIARFYSEEKLINIIRLLSVNILFLGISRLHRTYLYKMLCFRLLSIIDLIGAAISLLLLFFLISFGDSGIYSLIYSNIIVSFFTSIILFIYGRQKRLKYHFYFNYSKISSFFKIGMYQFAASFLDFFSREIDVVIIASLYPMNVVGVYTLCKQLVVKMYGILNPILSKVLTPILSIIQNDKDETKNIYSRVIEFMSFCNYPLYFCIASISYPLLAILYGSSYSSNYLILSIISITYGINSVASPVGNLEIALGRTDLGFYWTIYRVVSVVLIIYLFSQTSILTMTLAILVLTILSMLPFSFFLIKKMINIEVRDYFALQYYPFCCALFVMCPLLLQKQIYSAYITLLIFILLFIVGYLGLMFLLKRKLVLHSFECLSAIIKIK